MAKKKVLLLGAGLVARPLAFYLLDHGFELTVADCLEQRAAALVEGHPDGHFVALDASHSGAVAGLVAAHDLTVSLLPATMHAGVARICVDLGKQMVTASYVSDEMRALDAEARRNGVILLNELGVDPGIDHMSAMQIIHDVQQNGGQITSFRSYCGGLPAPEANDNPWGYKFSWSPMAVLRASTSGARYLKNGQLVELAPQFLFLDTHELPVEGIGSLEAYPNRDSLSYQQLYGLDRVSTMFRATLRYPGWCQALRALGQLGLLDDTPRAAQPGQTWADLVTSLVGARNTARLRQRVAAHLWLPSVGSIMEMFSWLGLLDDQLEPGPGASVMEQLAQLMQQKLCYEPGQRDMIVMRHEFVADYAGQRTERICSTMVDFGIPGSDSSMARTVSLPVAIGARMVLSGEITETGVVIPIQPQVYKPILAELAKQGIALREEVFGM